MQEVARASNEHKPKVARIAFLKETYMKPSTSVHPHVERPILKRAKVGYGSDDMDDREIKKMTTQTQHMNID